MYKKIISFILCAILCTSLCVGVNAEQKSFDGYVYFTVERITLGQGFIIEPTKVGFYKDESLAHITERVLGDKSTYDGDLAYYFLEAVIDGGEPSGWTIGEIPKDISKAVGSFGKRKESDRLSAFDYCNSSGWMFMLDNKGIELGAGGVTYADSADTTHFTDGSVVRLQFSLYGYGEDVGMGWGYMPFETTNTFADKSELIELVAEIKAVKAEESCSESYTNAMKVLNKWDATSDEILTAIENLEKSAPSPKVTVTENTDTVEIDIDSLRSMNIYVAFYNSDKTLNKVYVNEVDVGKTKLSKQKVSGAPYKVFVWSDDMEAVK